MRYLPCLSSHLGSSQNQLAYEGPGVDQSYPEQHAFLKGVEDGQYLDRNWTTVTGLPSGRSPSPRAAADSTHHCRCILSTDRGTIPFRGEHHNPVIRLIGIEQRHMLDILTCSLGVH